MARSNLSRSELEWCRPAGLADLGIVCCTRISRTSMVAESWLIGWQGIGRSWIDIGSTHHELRTGDVNFVPPRTAVSLLPSEPASRYFALLVPPEAVLRAATDLSSGTVTALPSILPVLRAGNIDSAALQMYFTVADSDDQLRVRAAWNDLMGQILTSASSGGALPASDPRPVQRAREFLHSRADELVSLDEIAHAAGVSKYYLVRLFHSAVGMSPYRYHLCVRAERARTLLDRGSTPSQAAAAAGFFDQSHFTRVFKKVFGVTPGMYARAPNRWRQLPTPPPAHIEDESTPTAERNGP